LPDAIIARGVAQLASTPRDPARFAKIAASDLFEPQTLAVSHDGALDQRQALVVEPAVALSAWTGEVYKAGVARLERIGEAWRLLDADDALLAEVDAVILCAGMASASLADLPLQPVRGQATWARLDDPPAAVAWGGYAIPTRDGVLFGATHDRDDSAVDLRPADHARNLATLAQALPDLAARLAGVPLEGRAAIRATTPDRLPITGALGDGLSVLTGLGSRGFSFAPLLAEHVAAEALGAPSPLPAPLARLVAPGRFAERLSRDQKRPI
jgi:tRNA 5-methylaminomethyl-2-thiouridine biosynthesis bifunctional protein